MGPKQKSGREGPIRRRERASALGCWSTWLRGTNGFPHAPPSHPTRGQRRERDACVRGRIDCTIRSGLPVLPSRPTAAGVLLTQEGGQLSKRARENEFSMLTEEEGDAVEELWSECHERSE